MHESGELKEVFAEKGVLGGAGKGDAPGAVTAAAAAAAADGQVDGAKGLQERLKALLSSSPTMLFMKMIEGTRLVVAFLSSLPLIPSSHPFLSSLPLIPSSLLRYLSGNTGGAAGTPEEPRCGFSRKVVDALTSEGISFGSFDILTDEAVRQGLKELSNWPTYPQVYHKGELIGGCDIVLEMKANGELKAELGG
ncbi:unnamed protein product [Closterium sp. NIES-65]|nr:unnamed protein product [Closterium sp. NIES-65]